MWQYCNGTSMWAFITFCQHDSAQGTSWFKVVNSMVSKNILQSYQNLVSLDGGWNPANVWNQLVFLIEYWKIKNPSHGSRSELFGIHVVSYLTSESDINWTIGWGEEGKVVCLHYVSVTSLRMQLHLSRVMQKQDLLISPFQANIGWMNQLNLAAATY